MKGKSIKSSIPRKQEDSYPGADPEGYPTYPPGEDIYGNYHKDRNINPENPTEMRRQSAYKKPQKEIDNYLDDEQPGYDLDIPGSESDEDFELTGNEDEENDYYSLGGDDHNDLEEDYGE